jgi:hypothetical protein
MTHELLLARRTTRRLSPAAARFLHDAIGESGPRGAYKGARRGTVLRLR